jgi:putative molybdopterin biosynthesis protein
MPNPDTRAALPGQFVSYAGSDIARGEALLRAGAIIGSREIGMLAACGIAEVPVARRPRVVVISTGDELVQPGEPLPPAAIYDTNGAIITAAINENGGEAVFLGSVPDDEERLEAAMRNAIGESDMLVLSGGTSKGAGDVSYRIIARLGQPGIIAHGVALKPGKPLCLKAEVTLLTPHVRVPDLVIVGSHCTGLDLVTAPLARAGLAVRSIAVGSLGGARRMRPCADPPVRRQDRNLQHTFSERGARAGARLAPDAGDRISKGRPTFRGVERRAGCACRDRRSNLHHGQP